MKILPLVGFYYKHSKDIEALAGHSQVDNSPLIIDAATAAVQLLDKHYPQLNKNGLLDDALATLKECLSKTDTTVAQQQGGAIA